MAKGDGRIKKGETRNPGGMTKEQRAERERANAVLLCPKRDKKWLSAYDSALGDLVGAVVLDYTYRRLGKPPDKVQLSGPDGESLGLPKEQRLKYLDALVLLSKGKT